MMSSSCVNLFHTNALSDMPLPDMFTYRATPVFHVFSALLVLLASMPGPAIAQDGRETVWLYEIPDPRAFVEAHAGQSMREALGQYVEAGRRQFIFVATRGTGYTVEIQADDNALVRRKKVKDAADRIATAAEGPVVSDEYRRLMRDVQRTVREETAGRAVFSELILSNSHVDTGAGMAGAGSPAASGAEIGAGAPPEVKARPEAEFKTPMLSSVLGRWVFLAAGVALLGLAGWGSLLFWRRRQQRQKAEAAFLSQSAASPAHAAPRGRASRSSDGESSSGGDRRRRGGRSTRSRSTRNGAASKSADENGFSRNGSVLSGVIGRAASGDSAERSAGRKGRRRRTQRTRRALAAGLLMVAGLWGGASVAEAQPATSTQDPAGVPEVLIAVDASGSDYDRSMADARAWLTDAVSDGETARVVAFGDSSWVAAPRVESLAEIDDVLAAIPRQSLTRLADALRFVEAQVREMRGQGGGRPQVRLSSDFESDDAGNEAMKYLDFVKPDSASKAPSGTAAARDTAATARTPAPARIPWWGWAGLVGAAAALLAGCWAIVRRRRDEEVADEIDHVALRVARGEDRFSYTWREVALHEVASLQEGEVMIAAREEDGRRTLLLGLEGTSPLEAAEHSGDTERPEHAEDGRPERRRRRRRRRVRLS